MAWTAPRNWSDEDDVPNAIVTAAMLNTDVRDNLLVLSSHTHTGADGMGAASMSGLTLTSLGTLTFVDGDDPTSAGELERNGNDLLWYGASLVNLTAADAVAGTASLRSLGTTSIKAAAGNHTHTISQQAESVLDMQTAAVSGTETDVASISYSANASTNLIVVSAVLRVGNNTHIGRLKAGGTTLETRTGLVATSSYLYIFQAVHAPGSTSSVVYKSTSQWDDTSGATSTCFGTLGITEVTI